jgi:phage recombination protein Bet
MSKTANALHGNNGSKIVLKTIQNQQQVAIWNEKLDEIKKIFAPNLSNKEFEFFVGLGKELGANPFLREIWAVKYDASKPAQIFVGRDFYRKKAQSLPQYNGHLVDAVYANDEFYVENGTPHHKYNLTNRGKLIGAYCVVYRKDIEHPYFVFVDFNEYNKGQSIWKEKPATMIKKVAEAQGLRGAFQGVFGGTYDESEAWIDENGNEVIEAQIEEKNQVNIETNNQNIQENTINNSDNEDIDSIKTTLNNFGIDLIIKDGFAKAEELKKGAIYQNREILKKLGFKFSGKKKIWYKKIA